ncbi:MAG: hypothetical protein EZS28_013512 [Streblomastix strix]|uniref:Uncharacterized protein n=1 Tax=Streblomastix strix TaxID=222440 RepID=A0A5J4W7Y1_9EUKA|nr:MAG: hypothetical protein EZS28_013512 [Streblomastix strix]
MNSLKKLKEKDTISFREFQYNQERNKKDDEEEEDDVEDLNNESMYFDSEDELNNQMEDLIDGEIESMRLKQTSKIDQYFKLLQSAFSNDKSSEWDKMKEKEILKELKKRKEKRKERKRLEKIKEKKQQKLLKLSNKQKIAIQQNASDVNEQQMTKSLPPPLPQTRPPVPQTRPPQTKK